MQDVKNDAYNLLEKIITDTKNNYAHVFNGEEEFTEYPYLHLSTLFDYIEGLEKINNKLGINLLSDIMNIDESITILGNVYHNLNLRLYDKLYCLNDDKINRIFLSTIKQQFYLTEKIEAKIRQIFLLILSEETNEIDDNIIASLLANLGINITFKYRLDDNTFSQHKKSVKSFFKISLSSNKKESFYRTYLDDLIIKTIDTLLTLTDEDLASDYYYSKGIALTVLLRAIFILINNYEELIQYEEYYNEKEPHETRAKKMLREAFIRHYEDSQKDSLKMLVKQ